MYYHLFISHAWKYGDAYVRLVNLLNNAPNFNWINWSAAEDQPVIPDWMTVPDEVVTAQIAEKISRATCILVIAGMYTNYSDWIIAEMEIAKSSGKPLIGVRPWSSERMPQEVSNRTVIDVGWNTDSIVDAIRRYGNTR